MIMCGPLKILEGAFGSLLVYPFQCLWLVVRNHFEVVYPIWLFCYFIINFNS